MVVPVNLIFALKAAIVCSLMLCRQSPSKRYLELSSTRLHLVRWTVVQYSPRPYLVGQLAFTQAFTLAV